MRLGEGTETPPEVLATFLGPRALHFCCDSCVFATLSASARTSPCFIFVFPGSALGSRVASELRKGGGKDECVWEQ